MQPLLRDMLVRRRSGLARPALPSAKPAGMLARVRGEVSPYRCSSNKSSSRVRTAGGWLPAEQPGYQAQRRGPVADRVRTTAARPPGVFAARLAIVAERSLLA